MSLSIALGLALAFGVGLIVMQNLTVATIQKMHAAALADVSRMQSATLSNFTSLDSRLSEISSRVGIIVKYYPADASGSIYEETRRVVSKATKSIHVLNSCIVERRLDENSDTGKKEAYYAELLDRAKSGGVEYTRLLQSDDLPVYLRDLSADDPIAFKHYERMQSLPPSKDRVGYAVLKRCDPTRLTNFVLVDDVHLIWQITEIDGKGPQERTKLLGAFIFDDPQSLITGHFRQYFLGMDAKGEPVPPIAATKGTEQVEVEKLAGRTN
jgi:hypothetical protein